MVEIKITSNPKFLTVVRGVVGLTCELAGFPPAGQRKIVLAVDEACSNIIRHTYQGDHRQCIEISCKNGKDLLEIVLRDCGPSFELNRIRPRDLDEIRPGGLGTQFIRSVMDEVKSAHEEGGGNTLRMVKRLHKTTS